MSSQIICAVSYSGKRLGAAIYDTEEKEVKIVADMAEDADFIALGRILREIRPTHVLANRSQDAEYQMNLRKECNYPMPESMDQNLSITTRADADCSVSVVADSQANSPTPQGEATATNERSTGTGLTDGVLLEEEPNEHDGDLLGAFWRPSLLFLPNIAFSFGHARKRLEQVFGDGLHNDKMMVNFRFDFSSTNMIRSLGALFRFMEQQKAGPPDSRDFNIRSCINSVSTYILEDCVEVDSSTVRALEIFYSNYTPQTIRKKFVWGNHRREGMSIFKLCNLCRSTAGKQMLRMWFERPSKDRKILAERHEAIAYLYQDCNSEITMHLRAMMKDVASIRGVLKRMRRGNLPISDWKNFFTTLCTLVKIGTFLDEREVKLAVTKGKLYYLGDPLKQLTALLIEVIDFPESSGENRLVIRKGVDPELDQKKELYEKLPEDLTAVARLEADEIAIESCSVAYVPIIGYLLMAPESVKIPQSTMSLVELVFSAEGMSYYKTKRMRLLDENIGDIKMQIVDAETNIVINLQQRILQFKDVALKAVELSATLDCLISLAVVARKYNWIRPKFVDDPILLIEQARHPIAEHICKSGTYVANPVFSSKDVGKVKILSGPNASGKSVYLKMVGVVVYMACCGSFVPAQRATIGPINRILSRLYTIDSVLDGMSSFANDLKQMSRAILRSDQHSLLIIDEFGKGTMTEVGLSLLSSCLNFWLEGPIEKCPHVLVASHFHALPNLLRDPNRLSRFQTMGVRRLDDDTLDFQFNLIDGTTDLSYATFTALKMGIPRDIVDRSEEVYIHLRSGGALAELEPIDITVKVINNLEPEAESEPDQSQLSSEQSNLAQSQMSKQSEPDQSQSQLSNRSEVPIEEDVQEGGRKEQEEQEKDKDGEGQQQDDGERQEEEGEELGILKGIISSIVP